jgi:hypothetical protein
MGMIVMMVSVTGKAKEVALIATGLTMKVVTG